jgi:hypothetical protein
VNALVGSLSIGQARSAVRWSRWARQAVEQWTTTAKPDVEWATETMRRAVRDGDGD